ncbi:MAG: imidazole glycerol phosphate synthase subunit HisH [Armatimonadota bacterium]|nr:imidazole glycerol phosphate synthase subunit HisH [Armatimonadota bacterium]MDR7427732.1 imidazole glycerol phosphate synthase subunit HisH [Armatimonadota bacterium]MDR7464631.1 imidazole glycerol phosphate synthase subunit HisH [Armatimonadota bacterium]MDR7469643.1 imidazole glycerol phosphate synthase subunit HisH [Armatimonadota bacterium]MDR7474926.1 imidazole glycerol phosphate synthase subunit HisH [Armatimonadota bacterium]
MPAGPGGPPRLAVVDYDAGNLLSLTRALQRAGAEPVVVRAPDPRPWEGIVLPGVGHFGAAMARLEAKGLAAWVRDQVQRGTPLVGICLGMHLLFQRGEEGGGAAGLGVLPGEVRRLPPRVKVPHMGWNQLRIHRPGAALTGLADGVYAYFVHSFVVEPADPALVTASTICGVEFPAVVEQDNLIGLQFHPEKSAEAGAVILNNLVRWIAARGAPGVRGGLPW